MIITLTWLWYNLTFSFASFLFNNSGHFFLNLLAYVLTLRSLYSWLSGIVNMFFLTIFSCYVKNSLQTVQIHPAMQNKITYRQIYSKTEKTVFVVGGCLFLLVTLVAFIICMFAKWANAVYWILYFSVEKILEFTRVHENIFHNEKQQMHTRNRKLQETIIMARGAEGRRKTGKRV